MKKEMKDIITLHLKKLEIIYNKLSRNFGKGMQLRWRCADREAEEDIDPTNYQAFNLDLGESEQIRKLLTFIPNREVWVLSMRIPRGKGQA
jgi:hypothetical protein